MFLHVSELEVGDVLIDHLGLDLIGGVLLGLGEVVVDLLEERRKFSEEQLDLDALVLEGLFLGLNRCDLDGVVGVVLLGQAVVLGSQSSADEDSLDLLRILRSNIAGVVSIGSVLAREVNDAVRCLRREELLGDSRVDGLKLLSVSGPVGRGQEELLEDLLRTLGDELGVSEGFVVAVVVDERSHVHQDLVDRNLIELGTQGLDGLPRGLLERPQDDVEKGWGLV